MDDITSPLAEGSAPNDESTFADLSADLDQLAVIEAELAAAKEELDALDAVPVVDSADSEPVPAP